LTIFVNKTDVQNEVDLLKEGDIEDYHGAIAIAGIRSGRLTDFIIGKRFFCNCNNVILKFVIL